MSEAGPAGGQHTHPGAIHVPRPSWWPITAAVGVALALVGVVLSWVMVAVGLIIAVASIVAWVRDARREFESLG